MLHVIIVRQKFYRGSWMTVDRGNAMLMTNHEGALRPAASSAR